MFDRELSILAIAALGEGCGDRGRLGIAWVLRNRLKLGKQRTAGGVALELLASAKQEQVLGLVNGELGSMPALLAGNAWDLSAWAADITGGATRFHRQGEVPWWTAGATLTVALDGLVFWKNLGVGDGT